MPDEKPCYGLQSSEQTPVALEGVEVVAEVEEYGARVTVKQRYRNREPHAIEAEYVFPLDEAAAVCGFEVEVDGRHVVGEVLERERAFDQYDDALDVGDGAYLLDQERPDVFTASVGNLPPGAAASVCIRYVTELACEGDAVRFTLPTTIAPRYAPAEDRRGIGRTLARLLNPPLDSHVAYRLSFTLQARLAGVIRSVESPSHAITAALDGAHATVGLHADGVALDRDVVILLHRDDDGAPHVALERDAAGAVTAMVSLRPHLPECTTAVEVIFLLDRSFSMAKLSLGDARSALQRCLERLPDGTRVNIVGFGDRYETLFPESLALNPDLRGVVRRHLDTVDADLGGTELLPPLQHIFRAPLSPGLVRQVVVLTDGEVTNTREVLALVRQHAGQARVFAFGLGAAPSHDLVRGLGRAGYGAAEIIYPGERLDEKVLRQVQRIVSPAVTNLRIDWKDPAARQIPRRVPAIFAETRSLFYAQLGSDSRGEVVLSGDGPIDRASWSARLDNVPVREGTLLATLAARRRIQELEDEAILAAHLSTHAERRAERHRDEIVRLAVAHGLLSSYTSYVAVEHRPGAAPTMLVPRRVPSRLAHGWGDTFGLETVRHRRSGAFGGGNHVVSTGLDLSRQQRGGDLVARCARGVARSAEDLGAEMLLDAQRSDGSWRLDDVASAAGWSPDEVLAAQPDVPAPDELREALWATALAVVGLRERQPCAPRFDAAARSGLEWLRSVVSNSAPWEAAALAFVRQHAAHFATMGMEE